MNSISQTHDAPAGAATTQQSEQPAAGLPRLSRPQFVTRLCIKCGAAYASPNVLTRVRIAGQWIERWTEDSEERSGVCAKSECAFAGFGR